MDDEITTDDETPEGIDAPADPAFTEHFTSPICDAPAGEFAPFGNDEGSEHPGRLGRAHRRARPDIDGPRPPRRRLR